VLKGHVEVVDASPRLGTGPDAHARKPPQLAEDERFWFVIWLGGRSRRNQKSAARRAHTHFLTLSLVLLARSHRPSSAAMSDHPPPQQLIGFGKLIIFGEHFVVYHRPALVGALEAYTSCKVTLGAEGAWSCGLVVVDQRPAVPGYKDEKKEEMLEATRIVLQHFNVDPSKRAVSVEFGGPLCAVSGVGASAASCVALARALGHALGLQLTEEQVNAAAFEGEKGYHGTPSGIDNTAATYGGLLRFQRQKEGAEERPASLTPRRNRTSQV
jgi:hypothetical protein